MGISRWTLVVALLVARSSMAAEPVTVPDISAAPAVKTINSARILLSPKEQKAVKVSKSWEERVAMPAPGSNGAVTFPFGATLPSVVCSPFFVCDIALQPGETINDVEAGDSYRWKVEAISSGIGEQKTPHVVVKPTDAGLATNLLITTDRRSYVIKLVSTEDQWTPLVTFSYPEDAAAKMSAYHREADRDREAKTLETGENIDRLDFNFDLSGDSARWRPVRVYSDGAKTYIQFPPGFSSDQVPALVALGTDGSWFSSPTEEVVNYRLAGDRYVVDRVLDRAALISGVGDAQQRIVITRRTKEARQ
jgi:P-type conjugative transfer protein TrbG